MNQTIVMPIGIIEEPASAGATFRLTPQGQQAGLKTDAQVTNLAVVKGDGMLGQWGGAKVYHQRGH